jgi:hypothetical protein
MSVRPRALVFRGVVAATGIALDVATVGEEVARARVLEMWRPGVSVHRAGRFRIVRFPGSVVVDTMSAPGAPLVRVGDGLSAAPLLPDEWAKVDAARDAIVLIDGGSAVVVDPADLVVEDPASWLGASFDPVDVVSFGDPPAAIVTAEVPPAETRSLLGVAEASAERAQILDALRAPAASSRVTNDAASASSLLFRLLSFVAVVLRWAGESTKGASAERSTTGAPTEPNALASSREASLGQRLRAWLQNAMARALILTRMAPFVGRRHAERLQRVLEMMDRGEYEEALRHAIPVGGPVDEKIAHVALGHAARRESLNIRPQATHASAIVPFAADVQLHLRETYRRAFERLAALGRNEEAAFVLAELLHANEEAVSFLENVGQRTLAAQLAEARGLPAGLVVRQWFVAGDWARALRVARRTGAFADALARLERRSKQDAVRLRIAWAESLAASGDYVGAHEVAWPAEEARPLARRWLDLAIDAGGIGGARALVHKLEIDPEALSTERARVDAALAEPSTAIAFGKAILISDARPAMRLVARKSARALLTLPMNADARKKLVSDLADRAGDVSLRADLPATFGEAPPLLAEREPPILHRVREAPSSSATVRDAVRLPNGRTLVALGEAGVRLLSREGRTVCHFDEPASALVVSDAGDRAIALARRGAHHRIALIDLMRRRARHWHDARLHAWSPDFDGAAWFVAFETSVGSIDVLDEERFAALWQVDVAGQAVALARSRHRLSFAVAAAAGPELWRYDVPSMILRWRAPIATPEPFVAAVAASGWMAALHERNDGAAERTTVLTVISDRQATDVPHVGALSSVKVDDGWIATLETGDPSSCTVFDFASRRERARIVFEGKTLTPRIFGGALTLIAGGASIVHVDLATGNTSEVRL